MVNYIVTTDLHEISKYLEGANEVSFDFETAPYDEYKNTEYAALDPNKSDIVGISLSVKPETAIYIPLKHKKGSNADFDSVIKLLLDMVFSNPNIIKIAHNMSFEAMFLYKHEIIVSPPVYDTIAASQLTLKSDKEFRNLSDSGLKTLVPELLKVQLPKFEDVTKGKHFDELDPLDAETIRYACADSDYTLQLYYLFNDWFRRYLPKHEWIVREIESPTSVYVGLMKYNGIPVDKELMLKKQAEAEEKLKSIKEEIAFFIGDVDIGANASTAAFKNYLYKDLQLPVLKITAKYQEAADDEAMILLADWCKQHRPELVKLFVLVKEYRKWGKIKATYIDGYLEFINNETGRIHPDLFPLGTETGRFASRKPNLQNCFDDKTEILTKRGFVQFCDLLEDYEVAQWENGDISFTKPMAVIVKEYSGDMIKIQNSHIDLCMTKDHRCLLQNRKNKQFLVVPANEYLADAKQLHAGQYKFGDVSLREQEIILLAATQADGNYHDGGIEFAFAKERKYYRLKYALDVLGIPYSEGKKSNNQRRIRVLKSDESQWVRNLLGNEKTWGKWLLDFDRKTIKFLLIEIMNWDGSYTRGSNYSSSQKSNVDWIQILYMLTGSRAHFREYWNGNPNSKINYQLDITEQDYSLTSNANKSVISYSGKVYCVTVKSSFIVVRRNGQVCITGNCPRIDGDPIGVRNCIISPKGKILLSLDFSQIELRVGAFFCRDDTMLETYRAGGDIHAQTTSVIYRIPFEQAVDKNAEHYKERRTIAKNCNFGTFFGLFPKGLQKTLKFKAGLDTSLSECEQIISNLKSGYPRLSQWQEAVKQKAAIRKYTETFLGRRRYLPNINSDDWGKKSFAQRCALNTPIQGTAADILKLAMVRVLLGLKEREWLKPLLQIHDELLFEVPKDKVNEAVCFIKACMETVPFDEFDVPIIAEASVGVSFGSMKELED